MFKRERDGGEAERGEKKQKTDTNTVESQLEYLHQMQAASSDGKSDVPESLSSEAPSRVVHFRNMTPDVEQGDIISLCSPFGQIDNVLIMRAKNQCLVMFHQLKEAVAFFNHFAQNFTSPTVRGRKMFVKYSRHQVITAANSAVSNILLATLDVRPSAFQVPITADVVWQIFSPYGTVAKIVIMNKGSLQSLIQFQTQAQCCTAFDYLHDKSVFVGTEPEVMEIRITVQYSHLGELTVRSLLVLLTVSIFVFVCSPCAATRRPRLPTTSTPTQSQVLAHRRRCCRHRPATKHRHRRLRHFLPQQQR